MTIERESCHEVHILEARRSKYCNPDASSCPVPLRCLHAIRRGVPGRGGRRAGRESGGPLIDPGQGVELAGRRDPGITITMTPCKPITRVAAASPQSLVV